MKYISYTTEFCESAKDSVIFCLDDSTHSKTIDNNELLPFLGKCEFKYNSVFISLPLSEDFHKALLEYFELGNEGISKKKLLKMYKATRDYKAKDLVKIERKEQERRRKYDEFFQKQKLRFPYHFCTNEMEVCINSNKLPKGIYAIDEDRGEYQSTSYTLVSDDKEKLVKYITKSFKGDALNESLEFAGLK